MIERFKWVLFVGNRYFQSSRRKGRLTTSSLSAAGIAVGMVALVSVLGVMNGFQQGFISDILEISSFHLRIAGTQPLSQSLLTRLRNVKGVRSVLPFADTQTMIKGEFSRFEACQVRGIPLQTQILDSSMVKELNIVAGNFDIASDRAILLGEELARYLSVTVGSPISLMSLPGGGFTTLSAATDTYFITGIFKSGYYNYDRNLVVVSTDEARRLSGKSNEYFYGVKLEDRFRDYEFTKLILDLGEDEGVEVTSWRDYNRAFFNALRIEKVVMIILLTLIFVVVGVNIFQGLRRTVFERREEIGVLRSLGAGAWSVQAVFVMDGLLIGFAGATIGLALGLLASKNINKLFVLGETLINGVMRILSVLTGGGVGFNDTQFFSTTYFYLTEVPMHLFPLELLSTFLFAVSVSGFSAYLGSLRAAKIQPTEVLRYE